MGRLFVVGLVMGLAAVLGAAHLYPWVQYQRVPSEASVVANGGRAETFVVRLPIDRIATVAGGGAAAKSYPALAELPPELARAAVVLEHFKLRNTQGDVIGIASRHQTETQDGPALAWTLAIPGRGAVMLVAPSSEGDVMSAALAQTGTEPGASWSGNLDIAAVGDRALTRTVASSQEFRDLDMRFTETWSVTGISEEGQLRGTIQLDTVGRRGI